MKLRGLEAQKFEAAVEDDGDSGSEFLCAKHTLTYAAFWQGYRPRVAACFKSLDGVAKKVLVEAGVDVDAGEDENVRLESLKKDDEDRKD